MIYIHELNNENIILVNSDNDPIGSESKFTNKISNRQERILIALAEYFGYEPSELLNLDCCKEI